MVDTDRDSRTIGTFGMEAMKRLKELKILIVGMRGLGVETAKNIILVGAKSIDIFDPCPVEIRDLGSNFYISEEDVGKKNRDAASLPKLQELNPDVKISIFDINPAQPYEKYMADFCEKIKKFNVVVFTEMQPMNFLASIDDACRANKIKFIYSASLGLTGYIFTDFGDEHEIYDETGEDLGKYLVKSITKDKNGLVEIDNVQGTNNLKIGDGDVVQFRGVEGMTELNDESKCFQIVFENYKSFRICDTSQFHDYIKGGVVYPIKQKKIAKYLDFKTRAALISDPMHPLSSFDPEKQGRAELLYMAFSGIHDYFCTHQCKYPPLNDLKEAQTVVENVKKMYDLAKTNKIPWFQNIQDWDEKVVLNTIRWAGAQICPVVGFLGGVVCQEIIKATGLYVPINQWLIMDFFEVAENISEKANRTLKNSRYDEQIAIFGNELQEKLEKSNVFLAGAGATGCEFIKNFAMMGLCTDKTSKLIVTDNDHIEISNLSRQFLFRKKDVGKPKSEIAANSAKKINPKFNIKTYVTKICKETETIFNEDFWNTQDFIIHAVDSVEARKYIDSKVVSFEKCSIDSGTLGTKAHLQVIVPHKTCTYSDNAPSGVTNSIPQCTLRHFPSLIQHCIEWARDNFYAYFTNVISEVKKFFENYKEFKDDLTREGSAIQHLERLEIVKAHVDMIMENSVEKMVEYAIKQYTEKYDHEIKQLLHNFPPDCKDKEGNPFWVGAKRCPHPISFDPKIDLCLLYVKKYVQILGHALGMKLTEQQLSDENIRNIASKVKIEEFVVKKVRIDTKDLTDEEKKAIEEAEKEEEEKKRKENKGPTELEQAAEKVAKLFAEMEKMPRNKVDFKKINPEEFEKDHDENGHIDFVHASSNLRARNYKIDECDRNKTKMIAGKIIATILTSTASIAGLVSLQLYTLLQTHDTKYIKNAFFNLGSNYYLFTKPNEPVQMNDKEYDEKMMGPIKAIPEGWNMWDRIEVKGSKTTGELIDYLEKTYKIHVDIVVANSVSIISTFLKSSEKKRARKVEDLFYEISKTQPDPKTEYLIVQIVGTVPECKIDGKDVKNASLFMPPMKYYFK